MTIDLAAPAALLGTAAADLAAKVLPSVVQVRGRGRGHGSGVVWRDGATVITNFHVVAGLGDALEVLTLDDRRFAARLIAGNPRLDLALLALAGGDLPPAPLGDSARLRVGDLVFAIGNPWGQRGVVTAGIVSGLGELERQRGEERASYIRSDVRLAPGNSGGPLLNAHGEVIGINAMIFGGDLSAAIPSHVALAWAERLPQQPVYLGLGVQPADLPAALRRDGQSRALLVAAVAEGGPARAGGLLVGDLLLRLDGAPLERSEALIAALAARHPGDQVRLEIVRGGAPLVIEVALAGR
jgi:serine protease Do